MVEAELQRIVLAGGPGAGKTAVLDVLVDSGFDAAADNAREIIRERKSNGLAPRPAPAEFGRAILERDIDAYRAADSSPTFFERGVVDAAGGLYGCGAIDRRAAAELIARFRYHPRIFVFPPWEEIYRTDSERDQSFEEAVSVYRRTLDWYIGFDYEIVEVPFGPVADRARFVLAEIG
jgi:predicted ATPase